METDSKKILVTPRTTLFKEKEFHGFLSQSEFDYESIILDNHEYIERDLAEQDPSYQQPIPYALICNEQDEVFIYQRGSKGNEKRLTEKWSCGIGGHIDLIDQESSNPIYTSLLREIEEELSLFDLETIELLGYINDDSVDVGQVHFGILYKVSCNPQKLNLAREIERGEFVSQESLKNRLNEFETWSQFALEHLFSQ
jgi:predicted NUDIX family phosphoesterase